MTKHALADAVAQFDTELAAYARLGKLFLDTPLSSVKHLERANGTLGEIAACEERLQAAGQALVQALAGARQHQEQLAQQVIAHVPAVQARNQRLNQLMEELAAVAREVSQLNEHIGQARNGDPTQPAADPREVAPRVRALSERAARLAADAREAELEELAAQAHALHQKLLVIANKLAG